MSHFPTRQEDIALAQVRNSKLTQEIMFLESISLPLFPDQQRFLHKAFQLAYHVGQYQQHGQDFPWVAVVSISEAAASQYES